MNKIPTTVVTGSLGAGKTTVIMNLIKQLPKDYKSVWLKNEYGDVNIDSELGKSQNIQTKEILNGCLCCVLIGKLHNALEEIIKEYRPDRLIIETAGTAYPYPIINEVSKIEDLQLDGLISVIDALNFETFKDKSPLAQDQSKYIDLIVINKTGLVDASTLDFVEDEVYEMYPAVPKVMTKDGFVDKDILIGLDASALKNNPSIRPDKSGLLRVTQKTRSIQLMSTQPENDEHKHDSQSEHEDLDAFSIVLESPVDRVKLEEYLRTLNTADFYRIKGIINPKNKNEKTKKTKDKVGFILLNYVLGRMTWDEIESYEGESKILFIGKGISGMKERVKEKIMSI